ncbi:MAG: 50S ribosomal protein L22 [Bacteriovoracales bacterium]|nr:50S ribosomal protein L22 [Bacteriovoracales bacterium]
MVVTVKNRGIGIAPRKVRLVADLIRRRSAQDALKVLRFNPKQEIALVLTKLINSGLAIAVESEKVDLDLLHVTKITVDGGRTLKRFQPRAKGRAFRIRKRSSHVTVELAEEGREGTEKE